MTKSSHQGRVGVTRSTVVSTAGSKDGHHRVERKEKSTLLRLRREVVVGSVLLFLAWFVLWECPPHWDTAQLALASGFDAHPHMIITDDGFVIELFHIPAKLKDSSKDKATATTIQQQQRKGVVYMQHGLLESSSVWVLHGRDSLPFVLASLGYDVWLGNNRGNIYGQQHTHNLTTSDPEFWNWTWYDMALHDFPSQLHYILDYYHKEVEQIIYIGQSQGAAQGFAGLSMRPELIKHIRLFIAIAPGLFLKKATNPGLDFLFDNVDKGWFGEHEFVPYVHLRNYLPKKLLAAAGEYCMRKLEFIANPINNTASSILYSLVPSGTTSTRNVKYWVQLATSGEFEMPDYGEDENRRRYSTLDGKPKKYELERVDCPIALFLSGLDTAVDLEKTTQRLNHKHLHIEHTFAHADYIWSTNATDVYPKIIDQILLHS
eukprot:TRINITY_DN7450_c0_g1_i1.p1 TRINITY_DN7450_c0_g1~~TRINITY_DN7450_c0_g1_i1.p1  ORF type:complete len:432 (+),score=97.77 TRINITY_DN7450_c0_g1_i1:70-1365(+)